MRKRPHPQPHAAKPAPAPLREPDQAEPEPSPDAVDARAAPESPAAEPCSAQIAPCPEAEATEPAASPPVAAAVAEPDGQNLARLERELADARDRLLRTAADFDNFRKRAAKDKAETWGRAQADVAQRILESIDDLGRVAHLDPAQTSAQSLHEGVGLVERKLLKALEAVGLERLDPSGSAFDPNLHEAVMTAPAPSEDMDGKVSMVFQPGYRLAGLLLRPARVAVYAWAGPPPAEQVN